MSLINIQVLIFDWSGVISDDRKPVYEANIRILKEHGKPTIGFEEFLRSVTMTPAESFSGLGIPGSFNELFTLYKKHYNDVIRSGMLPNIYPDACDVLNNLKNKRKKIAVLSSHPVDNLKAEAEEYGIISFFDLISGNAKSKTDGLETICIKLNINPESALYIGDTIHDIRSAKKTGVHSAGICTGYHTKEMLEKEKPDFLLENLSELKKIL